MTSLQLADLLRLMDEGVDGAAPPRHVASRAAAYAAAAWAECRLPGAAPGIVAYAPLTRRSGRYLCHFDTGATDQYLIVVCAADGVAVDGCVPVDIGGQYRPVTFEDLSTGFVGEPTEALLAQALPWLRDGGTPAAILDSGEGSYLQTWQNGPDNYELEYQLVTTQFHFAAAGRLGAQDVLEAFRSYAFGRYEWARDVRWLHRPGLR